MTELDAVNYLLGILGSSPVGALTNKNPDVSVSQAALTAAIVSVTSEGFWFNEVYDVDFVPDPTSGQINTTGYTKLITRNYYGVVRGNDLLFDPKNNTYVWENTVTADCIAILDFEELPDAVQQAVQFFAATALCSTDLEDATKRAEQETFYNNAFRQIKQEDLEVKRRNSQMAPSHIRLRQRVTPARLGLRRGPNFGGRGY